MRAAKFPKKFPVIAYQRIMPHFRDFLHAGNDDCAYFDKIRARLEADAKKEIGTTKSELLRCVKAIDAFIITYSNGKLANHKFSSGHADVAFKLSGVSINCRLNPPIIQTDKDGALHSGGCVMFTASGAQSRKNIEDRTKFVAAIVHWTLENVKNNIRPSPKLCLSFDVFGGAVVRAPTAYSRLRDKMEASCLEIASGWARIEPPDDYDGPAWR